MRGLLRGLAAIVALGSAVVAGAQAFDNREVLSLHRAGLGSRVLIAKINALPCNFDTSTEAIIGLSKAGVGQDVIAAMIERCTGSARAQGVDNSSADPLAKHAPGIYLYGADPATGMAMLRPAASAGIKVTGNGSLLFPRMAKLTVTQAQSQTVIRSGRPTFYFYFNVDDDKVRTFGTVNTLKTVNTFGTMGSDAAQSPNEFSLIQFKVDKETRQFVVGRVQPYVEISGVDPKNTLAFSVQDYGDGIFKVQTPTDLAPGEYAFVLPGAKMAFRIYDFSVRP